MTLSNRHASNLMTTLLTPAPDKQQEFLQTLRSLRSEIGRQPGCLACTIFLDEAGGSQLALITSWKDPTALKAHVDSESFRVLVGASQALGASPEFRFSTSSQTFEPA
jgi:quinol monooxygenase YgiN